MSSLKKYNAICSAGVLILGKHTLIKIHIFTHTLLRDLAFSCLNFFVSAIRPVVKRFVILDKIEI